MLIIDFGFRHGKYHATKDGEPIKDWGLIHDLIERGTIKQLRGKGIDISGQTIDRLDLYHAYLPKLCADFTLPTEVIGEASVLDGANRLCGHTRLRGFPHVVRQRHFKSRGGVYTLRSSGLIFSKH